MPTRSDAHRLTEAGDYATALAVFVDSNADGAWSEADMETLAKTLFEVLRRPLDQRVDVPDRCEQAFDLLVQDDHHLAFHKAMLSRHLSGLTQTFPDIARAFGPRLLRHADAEAPPGMGVLAALLLLRHVLPLSATLMARLPQWHHQALGGFTATHVSLLYNTMFDRISFRQNVIELQAALPGLDWLQQWHRHGSQKILNLLYYWPERADQANLRPLQQALKDTAGTAPGGGAEDLLRLDLGQALQRTRKGAPAAAIAEPDPTQRKERQLWAVLQQYGLRRIGWQSRRPRVAVCISGQLRGYLSALSSWRKHLLPGVDADFFVHSWTRTGRSGAEPFRAYLPFEGQNFQRCYREQCLRLGLEDFTRQYPHLFQALADSSEVTAAHLSEVYGTDQVVLEDDKDVRFFGWSNSRKMHYKIAQAQAMVDGSGQEYDLMLRIRPDKAMRLLAGTWADICRTASDGLRLFTDLPMGAHCGCLMIGDQFALGRPETMRIYGQTYADALVLESRGLLDVSSFLQGHVSLARQCWLHGVHVHKFPARFGGLQEFAPLASAAILEQLRRDAEGRNDSTDRLLMDAVSRDIADGTAQSA